MVTTQTAKPFIRISIGSTINTVSKCYDNYIIIIIIITAYIRIIY